MLFLISYLDTWKLSPYRCPPTHFSLTSSAKLLTHKIEYYLAIKRNEVLVHDEPWMNLENFMLNGRSKSQKTTYYTIPFI